MACRTNFVSSLWLTSLVLGLFGCGYNQQSKFQMSFLPPPPRAEALNIDETEPPYVEPNPYLSAVPAVFTPNLQGPRLDSRGDALVEKAERRFQRGKRFYQAKDTEHAREEFDTAVDLMLEASDYAPGDRQVYEKKLEEMVDAIHRYDLAGLGSSATVEEAAFEKAPLEDILQMTFPVDPKLKNRVQEQVQATVSQLPLSVTDAVLGYIHYFSGRGHRTMVAGLERAGKYKPLIQRILDEEGLPQELIHLAQAESGFLPRAVSRKAAVGMWQFVQFRGRQYGLAQTRYTDDRLDPERATRAAAKHLRDLYNEFGDWYLAIAAYNCGPGVIERAVERTGYADFWELRKRRVLPAETTNYVPIILAMTIMEKNAAEYGLGEVTPEPPLQYDTVEMTSPTNLALVADLTDAPLSELMALNPALLKNIAPENYSLHVPKGASSTLTTSLQSIPASHRAAWRMHTVASGETLATIGKRYGAAPSSIAAANRIDSAGPAVGDRLVIPAVYTPPKAVAGHSATGSSQARRGASRRSASTRRAATAQRPSAKPGTAARPARKGPAVLTRTASNISN